LKNKIVGPYFLFSETLKLNAPEIAQKAKKSFSFSSHPRIDSIMVVKVTAP
jgi:hypothetical protein